MLAPSKPCVAAAHAMMMRAAGPKRWHLTITTGLAPDILEGLLTKEKASCARRSGLELMEAFVSSNKEQRVRQHGATKSQIIVRHYFTGSYEYIMMDLLSSDGDEDE